MAGRGVGRGTSFGRGIRFETLPDSQLSTGVLQAAGRGFPRGRIPDPNQPGAAKIVISAGNLTLTSNTTSGRTGRYDQERRKRGDFDPDRQSYHIPKRFRDSFVSHERPLKLIDDIGKGGSEGAKVALRTNYFHVRTDKTSLYTVAMFTVQFEPIVEFRQERLAILSGMSAMKKINLGFFYDGKVNVFMPTKLHGSELNGKKTIEEDYTHLRKGKVTLVFRGTVGDPKEFDELKTGTAHGVLNNVLAEMLTDRTVKDMVRIEDGFFSKGDETEIAGLQGVPFKLKVWPGYLPVLRQFDAGLLLNLDLCNRFIRTGTVLDAMKRIPGQLGTLDHAKACQEVLKGMIVITKYNDQAYRIYEVTTEKTLNSTFERKIVGKSNQGQFAESSSNMTIKDYIQTMYGANPNAQITVPNQPLLLCTRASGEQPIRKQKGEQPETIPIVPELSLLTGLTDDLRTNFSNMNKILDSVRKEPGKRGEICRRFALGLSNNPDAKRRLAAWAMTMEVDLLELEGRELPTVHLAQASNKKVAYDRQDADWTRNLRGNRLDEVGTMNDIAVLFSKNDEKKAEAFYEMLGKVGGPMGMKFSGAATHVIAGSDHGAFGQTIKSLNRADMVLCILPDNKKERYEGIKSEASNSKSFSSQCILAKNVDSKSAMSIATKLALQMNAKLGGALWHIKDPAIKGPGVAVVGVVSGRALDFKGSKMASFVGTVNDAYNKFYSSATPVSGSQMKDAYKNAFEAISKRYANLNKGALIDRFIVYRQIDTDEDMFVVCDKTNGELQYAQEAARNLKAKLVYCVAVKRCSSRFFGTNMGNPRAGTVIDQDVTLPNRFDFYMVSHSGRRGSVMPTYYFIVQDEIGLNPNQMQNFTFQMCHMYYNWSGTIKVPAVCQYAFKLATMCGEVTKAKSNEAMADRLWYL